MKKKLVFWAAALLIIVFCAAFMTSCSSSEPTEKPAPTAMYGKMVITQINDYDQSKDSVWYKYEQEMSDYTYNGDFVAGRNEFALHDVITFALATESPKSEDSTYTQTQE